MGENETDVRPAWPFKTREDLARWILRHSIVKITHHWKFTGEDTSEHWMTLHADDKGGTRDVNVSFLSDGQEFNFSPNHRTLVQPRQYLRPDMGETINTIDNWERKNKRERADYERLRRKFERFPKPAGDAAL